MQYNTYQEKPKYKGDLIVFKRFSNFGSIKSQLTFILLTLKVFQIPSIKWECVVVERQGVKKMKAD